MTSEICLMNRHAIVLAADSATTVTQWVGGRQEQRFFKGANKIFQVSNHHPVGLMIYGAADLQKVPWEIIVKDFRTYLKDKSFNRVEGYATEFGEFIKSHVHLYPQDYQVSVFKNEAESAALRYLVKAQEHAAVKAATDDNAKRAAFAAAFADYSKPVDAKKLPDHFKPDDVDDAILLYKKDLKDEIDKTLAMLQLQGIVDAEQLAELAIKALFKFYPKFMTATGVVLAGYGDHDYFPRYQQYECYGLLLGKFLFDKQASAAVDLNNPSHIKPFATTAMVNTFSLGFSPDVFGKVQDELEKALRVFADSIKAKLGATDIPDLDQLVIDTIQSHTDAWTNAALETHAWPLRRVIGSLPVDEMAELAETLIMLQSLKEKVTQPTESVSGPIDVAAITKGDGFIWVKRKHYFDPKLNPRFFLRQGTTFQGGM